MTYLQEILRLLIDGLAQREKPFAVILAGHNGSGKSTMWYKHLSAIVRVPLVNADRMMLSILPESSEEKPLPEWAVQIRDKHEGWMRVAQKGVEAFVAEAMAKKVSFAMETVFSDWRIDPETGQILSKINKIHELQKEGYFVVLLFVGLADVQYSITRVESRVRNKKTPGHDVPIDKLISRFPRTQKAIRHAVTEADASVLVDNSRTPDKAFTVCRVQTKNDVVFDLRQIPNPPPPPEIEAWMSNVCPDVP